MTSPFQQHVPAPSRARRIERSRFLHALAGRVVSMFAVVLTAGAPASASEAPQASALTVTPAPDADGVVNSTSSPTVGGEFHMKDGSVVKTITITVKPTGTQSGVQPSTVKVLETTVAFPAFAVSV